MKCAECGKIMVIPYTGRSCDTCFRFMIVQYIEDTYGEDTHEA